MEADTAKILENICFVKEVSLKYYRDNDIPYEETESDIKTELNVNYPKIAKRKPSAIQNSSKKKEDLI